MIRCEHAVEASGGRVCRVVQELSGLPLDECRVGEDACGQCVLQSVRQARNHVTVSMAIHNVRRAEPERADEVLRILTSPPDGVGTELSALLSRIGITAEPGCQCKQHAAAMNRQGIAWCESNEATIVGWLKEEAKRRGLPFNRLAAAAVIRLAIWRAKRMRTRMDEAWRGVS